ncbi:MAG: hypothetical protein V3W31_09680 [Thermodesulfobacteriota bacterium]
MTKEDLETKARKAVLRIEKKVTDMNNVLYGVSAKLCHLIKRGSDYYSQPENGYYK